MVLSLRIIPYMTFPIDNNNFTIDVWTADFESAVRHI